jgi:hypothetical protein
MTTIYIDYPTEFVFRTRKTFTNDDERTDYLHTVLRRNKVSSPSHNYTDYVVEGVIVNESNETEQWIIGS